MRIFPRISLNVIPSRNLTLAATILGLITIPVHGSITMTLIAGTFTNSNGNTPVAEGTLFQLVNLGADAVFNPIALFDGDNSPSGQWVSGDDTLITAAYLGKYADYGTLGGFDLTVGTVPDAPGVLNRTFTANIPVGTKFGLRWFPGLTAANYYLPGGITLSPNQSYGQFTRQDDPIANGPLYDGPIHGAENWVVPADGQTIALDGLVTISAGGGEANFIGQAIQNMPIPEPASLGVTLLGAASLLGRHRRRS